MFQRMFRRHRRTEQLSKVYALPDPMKQFPHSGNQELFSYLMSNWQLQGLPPDKVHEPTPHPELVELFDEMVGALGRREIRKATMYGKRLAATSDNLIFAWAQGTRAIFIRLNEDRHKEALAAGGRLDRTYPPDWVEFLAGGTRMAGYNSLAWRSVIMNWLQISYDDCMGLK